MDIRHEKAHFSLLPYPETATWSQARGKGLASEQLVALFWAQPPAKRAVGVRCTVFWEAAKGWEACVLILSCCQL